MSARLENIVAACIATPATEYNVLPVTALMTLVAAAMKLALRDAIFVFAIDLDLFIK